MLSWTGAREGASRAVMQTAHALARDVVTAEAVDVLRRAGVRSIVLKGASFARWLYADGSPRPYADSDLLVDPARLEPAARALKSIGYSLALDDRIAPGADAHHQIWRRGRDGATVELHWRLPWVRVAPDVAWRRLAAETETAPLAGAEVEFLRVPARALHLALHAAQHAGDRGKPVEDLRRGLRLGDESCWRAAAALAAALGAQDAFAAGLRAIPEGVERAASLALPPTRHSSLVEMRAAGASGWSVNLQRLLCERGPLTTGRALLRAAVPSVDFMRYRYVGARTGRAGLAAAYLRRWAAIARDARPVLRSVVRANSRPRA
jgi:hypothetical protein